MADDPTALALREALWLALHLAWPSLLAMLAIGLVISVLQAVTQIQEQTLTFIPKITAMFAAAILLFPWIGHRLIEYTGAMLLTGQLP